MTNIANKGTKRCPFCGEEVLAVAKKCKHCGQWLEKECPHCHRWIKATAQKCHYCKQWVNKQEIEYYEEDDEQDSVLKSIFDFFKDGCLNLLGYAIGIAIFCLIAWGVQPTKSEHIEIAKTKLAESAWAEFARHNTRIGEIVNCYGYFIVFDNNFKQNVKKAYESRYEFKVYDLKIISCCDIIDKKTNEESTITYSAFGIVILVAKPIILKY